jgi:hypothetical protein
MPPRYFLELPGEGVPRAWDPRAGPRARRADARYFGTVFREMERTLQDPAIDVYLTWDPDRLPAYGDRVVAVVLGDEVGRIPRYVGRVRAVFKCYGTRPVLGAGPVRNPGLTGSLELAQYALRWLRWLPGGAAHARLVGRRRLRGEAPPPAVNVIPVGTFNQIELPVVPIEERGTDVFFAGSVQHGPSLLHRLGSPKPRARRKMLAALERLRVSRPDLRTDLRLTPSFKASAAAAPAENSRALMNAKVSLAPRGTSLETFRVFEALRFGCVVIGDRLPRHWFYDGAPVIQLNRWGELERALVPMLDDGVELRRRHERALAWWRERCSEAAVGRFMAERLNGLGAPAALSARAARPVHPPGRA